MNICPIRMIPTGTWYNCSYPGSDSQDSQWLFHQGGFIRKVIRTAVNAPIHARMTMPPTTIPIIATLLGGVPADLFSLIFTLQNDDSFPNVIQWIWLNSIIPYYSESKGYPRDYSHLDTCTYWLNISSWIGYGSRSFSENKNCRPSCTENFLSVG